MVNSFDGAKILKSKASWSCDQIAVYSWKQNNKAVPLLHLLKTYAEYNSLEVAENKVQGSSVQLEVV